MTLTKATYAMIEGAPANVRDFGAVGDGVTDDTAAIQAAIDAVNAAGGGRVDFPSGVYLISATLNLKSNVHLLGVNASIDYRAIPKVYDINGRGTYDVYAIRAAGTTGTAYPLTADAIEKESTAELNVFNAANFSAGDWVQIGDESYYPYAGTFTVKRGEIKKIRSVSSGVLSFTTVNYEGYAVSSTAFARKISFVENIGICGLKFIGSNVNQLVNNNREAPVWLEYVKDFWVENNIFTGQDFIAITAQSSIVGNIQGNHITGVFRQSSSSLGSVYYGIALRNNAQYVTVTENHGETLRRLVVNTASQLTYGQPYHNIVSCNIMRDSHSNSSGRVEAFEHHGFGRWISYLGNISDSTYGGIRIEGRDLIVANNHFVNCSAFGIQFDNEAKVFENIHVIGNTITRAVIDDFSSSGAGIYVQPPGSGGVGSAVFRNVVIENNTINGFIGDSRNGIRIDNNVDIAPQNCAVRYNTIDSLASDLIDELARGILCYGAGWLIEGNNIYNYYRGVELRDTAENCQVSNNRLQNASIFNVSSESGIAIYSINNRIYNNSIENFAVGIRFLTGNETGNKCWSNKFWNVTTTFGGTLPTDLDLRGNLPPAQYGGTAVISSDTITLRPTDQSLIVMDTESSAATDDLSTITATGSSIGRIVVLKTTTSTRDITVKDNVGNIQLAGGDMVLDTASDSLTLLWTGSQWVEVARSNNA